MSKFVIWFTKITAWPSAMLWFRPKVFFENKKVQSTKIKGKAIIASNHLAFSDFSLFFVFIRRTVRFLMGELFMERRFTKWLFTSLGCIKTYRNAGGRQAVRQACEVLDNNGVVGIFPESHLPEEGDPNPMPFKTGIGMIALRTMAPIVPVFKTKTCLKHKTYYLIGTPIYPQDIVDPNLDNRSNIVNITRAVEQKVLQLKSSLEQKLAEKNIKLEEVY